MSFRILLYGATGYSGRLIAAEGAAVGMGGGSGSSMILAGRDNDALAKLGDDLNMDHRAFCLDDKDALTKALVDVDVIVNAAGPFDRTAPKLAKGALLNGCHYVDINGEVDVYKKLEQLGVHAKTRNIAMVCSAGHTSAASDLLLHVALDQIRAGINGEIKLGAVRIAMARLTTLSRGSILTLLRSGRQQVAVVRMGALWHEPVGKLERTIDFGTPRIATAANLVDTFSARLTTAREKFTELSIESYVEAGALDRIAYQVGAFVSPLTSMPWARELACLAVSNLPPGPTAKEREAERHTLVLEIEDPAQRPLVRWRWKTPNPYDFTAQVVVEVAKRLTSGATKPGWRTPSEVLAPAKADLSPLQPEGYLCGCLLHESRTP